ncbi:MAG TPA: ABC transporter substrate-binding protein [Ramlibacter sp.]|nr:ABC transporter substrate-binding protein [Ramlibacter sp.]
MTPEIPFAQWAELSRRRLLGAMAAAAALPTSVLAQGAPRRGGVLRVSAANNPSTLDPMTGRSGFDHPLLYPLFDTLVEFDYGTLAPKSGLARAWIQPDPTTLLLELHDGVSFHDGTRFDAEAVRFNLERSMKEQRSVIRTDLASIASVQVTGPLQVTIRLKAPDSSLLLALSDRAGMMVSPKAVQELGNGTDRRPVGTGAYTFVSWTDNAKLILKRNERYWRKDRPHLDGLEFQIIPELNTGLRSVTAGENDFVYQLSRQQQRVVERASNLGWVASPTLIVHMLYLNMGRKPFADLKVRQALNYAIDRESFNRITQDGEATRSVLPKEHWAYDGALAKTYPYDPARAKRLLSEAGYPNGFDLAAMGWNDQKAIQRQEILIEQLGKVGIRARFGTASVADSTSQFMQDKRGDAYLGAFTGRPDPSQIFARLFDPNSVINAGRVDPAPERAAAQLATQATADVAERKAAFAKLQKIVSDHALCVPITVQHDLAAYSKKVGGYQPNLTGKPKFETVFLNA